MRKVNRVGDDTKQTDIDRLVRSKGEKNADDDMEGNGVVRIMPGIMFYRMIRAIWQNEFRRNKFRRRLPRLCVCVCASR